MRYCKSALMIENPSKLLEILTKLASSQFRSSEALPLDDHQFNIDAGMNDVRAIWNPEKSLITFCCRYESDVVTTEKKIQRFAKEYNCLITDFPKREICNE